MLGRLIQARPQKGARNDLRTHANRAAPFCRAQRFGGGSGLNSRITGILGDLTAFLTIVAVAPYEFGTVADIFPPEWKKWVASAGAIATVTLRLIKRVQAPQVAVIPAQPEQTIVQP